MWWICQLSWKDGIDICNPLSNFTLGEGGMAFSKRETLGKLYKVVEIF